jgi:hypothetical protein
MNAAHPAHEAPTAARKKLVEKWALKLAVLAEPDHDAGWGIYYDWLNAFLADVNAPTEASPPLPATAIEERFLGVKFSVNHKIPPDELHVYQDGRLAYRLTGLHTGEAEVVAPHFAGRSPLSTDVKLAEAEGLIAEIHAMSVPMPRSKEWHMIKAKAEVGDPFAGRSQGDPAEAMQIEVRCTLCGDHWHLYFAPSAALAYVVEGATVEHRQQSPGCESTYLQLAHIPPSEGPPPPSPPGERTKLRYQSVFFVNGDKEAWDYQTITGREVRLIIAALDNADLLLEVAGQPDQLVDDATVVDVTTAVRRFYTMAKGSTAGSLSSADSERLDWLIANAGKADDLNILWQDDPRAGIDAARSADQEDGAK